MESKQEHIDAAERNKWFLEGILERLLKTGWNYDSDKNELTVLVSEKYDYNIQTIQLVQKRLSTKQWNCILRKYSRKKGYSVVNGDVDYNYYTFWMEKKKEAQK